MWALVLLPLWARRHHDALVERAGEGFTRAVRVLARGSSATGQRRGAGGSAMAATHSGQRQVAMLHQLTHSPQLVVTPRQRQAAAAGRVRRRRTLTALLLACVMCAVLVVFTAVPILLMALPLTLLGPYVVVLTAVARREREAAAQALWSQRYLPPVEADYSRIVGWGQSETDLSAPPASAPAQPIATPATTHAAPAHHVAPTTPLFDAQAPQPFAPPGAGPHWDPRETLLPTYVQANTAHRRSIVLSGSWQSPLAASTLAASQQWAQPEAAAVEESVTILPGPKPDARPAIDEVIDLRQAPARAVGD